MKQNVSSWAAWLRSTGMAVGIVLAGLGGAGSAGAQTIGIGTTQGGATGQIGLALAQVISQNTEYQAVPRISANTSQYIPMVDSGQIEFGIANYPQTYYAVMGTGMSTEPSKNLRLVASLMPFLAGLVAAEDTGITEYKGLKGKAVPRYQANSLGDFIIRAALAAGGLTYDDVKSVPVANFPQQYEAFKDRRIDVSIATVGSQPTFDLEAAVGKIVFIPFEDSQLPALAKELPGIYLRDVAPDDKLPGIAKGTRVFGYDYLLFANKDVDDKVVGAVAKAIYEGETFLKGTSPLWVDFDPKLIGKKADIPMHPGAVAFYKSVGAN